MSTVKMRPTFLLDVASSGEELLVCIQRSVKQHADEYGGRFTKRHALIFIEESKRHFWSPWLNLEIREHEGSDQLFGRFSPHPSIWTGFMFSYLVIVVLAFFSAILGTSQLMMSHSPWGFYLIPLEIIVGVVLWIGSQTGQKLAHDEMVRMKRHIETCVEGSKQAGG